MSPPRGWKHISVLWLHQLLRGNNYLENRWDLWELLDKQKQKWHLASSTEDKGQILLGTSVLPLPFKNGQDETEVHKSKNIYR